MTQITVEQAVDIATELLQTYTDDPDPDTAAEDQMRTQWLDYMYEALAKRAGMTLGELSERAYNRLRK